MAEHTRLGSTVGDVPGAVLGFVEDVDIRPADGVRVTQLTPPGSACSVTTGLCQGGAAADKVNRASRILLCTMQGDTRCANSTC